MKNDAPTCFASLEPQTMDTLFRACCPEYANEGMSEDIVNPDGMLTLEQGEDVHCMHLYDFFSFDKSNMHSNNLTLVTAVQEPYLGCYLTKKPVNNFHPVMEEIFECCPQARDAVLNEDWETWDFNRVNNGSAICYKNYYGDCYIEYVYHNASRVLVYDDEEYISEGECSDYNLTFVPHFVEYTSYGPCEGDFKFDRHQEIQYEYSTDAICPDGWNSSNGFIEYTSITSGMCSDYGYENVSFDECYEQPQVWKNALNELTWNEIDTDALFAPQPTICTVTTRKDLLSETDMNEYFTNQTCSPDFPCVCRRNTTCEYVYQEEKDCSETRPCICKLNATSCVYPPGINETCTCVSESVIPDPGPYQQRFPRDVPSNVSYVVNNFWRASDYDFVSGVTIIGDEVAVMVNKQSWLNISSDIPVGVAAQTDDWRGAYTDEYHYEVETYDTEEILINMRGGVDWEATRGTDEFRYCRHEFDIETQVQMDTYYHITNKSNLTTNLTTNNVEIEFNKTVTRMAVDGVYCNSFFPSAVKKDGIWTCTSIRECPLWEYWPPTINEYGFVETDPCVCSGVEQYGGYCIPDAYTLTPKKGDTWQTLHNISQIMRASLSASGRYMAIQNDTNIQINVIDTEFSTIEAEFATEEDSSFVLSSDGSTLVVHASGTVTILILGEDTWTQEYTEHVGTLADTSTPMAISEDGLVVSVLAQNTLHVFEKGSIWKTRPKIQGFVSGNVALSHNGSTVAFSTQHDVRIYDWDNTVFTKRGVDIDTTSGHSLVQLSPDGSLVALSDDKTVQVFAWENGWIQRGDGIFMNAAIQGLGFFQDTSTMLTCSSDSILVTKWERRKWLHVASHNVTSVSFCDLSTDQSVLATMSDGVFSIMTTGMEPDVFKSKNIWVTDVDQLFTNTSLVQYYKPCSIGNIKKAANFSEWTDILWWQDVHERACTCQSDEGLQLCNGHRAQELFVGWDEQLSGKRLMTMTCASDGCVYDEINKERWQDTKELYEDCSNAKNEICGVYGFGKYHNEMSFKILKGLYDSDNIVTSGVFKCEYVNGLYRNNFFQNVPSESALYSADGDFNVMPNGMPSFCACAHELCHYDQYCKIVTDFNDEQAGYCGNTKHEVEQKVLHDNVLGMCNVVPEEIVSVDLSVKQATQDCVCELPNQERIFCQKGEYCSSKGCVECVCDENEWEFKNEGLSSCLPLTDCAIGEYTSQIQTQVSDRVCSPCEQGVTYSPFQNAHKCVNCTQCRGSTIEMCTVSSDAICGPDCAFDEEPINGECVPKCQSGYHRLFNTSCIQCDFGQYFGNNTCQNCPEDHYTLTRDKSLVSASVVDICFKHKTCDMETHYWYILPNASFPGTCILRYSGNCANRTKGGETSDDICFNYRDAVDDYVVAAHAYENNVSSYSIGFYLHENKNQIRQIQYILETQHVLSLSGLRFVFPVISRYTYQDEHEAEQKPYFDARYIRNKVRIYTHIDQHSLQRWNLPTDTFFVGHNVSTEVTYIFFTIHKSIVIDTGGWTCSNTSDYAFICTDTTPPELTLNGEHEMVLLNRTKYTELGAIAYDHIDLDLTHAIDIQNNVNETKDGDYEVVYSVHDHSGNEQVAIRHVRVVLKPIVQNTTNSTSGQ